jgi:transcriptional regulator with XRE-family HTH domain
LSLNHNTDCRMKVLDNIKKIRNLNSYSQEYMADKLNMATVNYGKVERGKTALTVERLYDISKLLNVSVGELLGIETAEVDKDLLKKREEELDKIREAMKATTLINELLLREKEFNKTILMNTISRYSNHVLSYLKTDMKNASNDTERNIFERQMKYELINKQDMFESLISLGFITQTDLDDFNKEREEIYGLFGMKTPN